MWSPLLGAIGLLGALILYLYILRQAPGTELMVELSSRIYEGAMAYLRRQYTVLAAFVIVVAALLWLAIGREAALASVTGARTARRPRSAGLPAAPQARVRAGR